MKKFIILLVITISFLSAKLIPSPLFTQPEPIQRIGWQVTQKYLGVDLFAQAKGISFVKLRVDFPETFLGIISDETWSRLVYIVGVDSMGQRYAHFIKAFDNWSSPQYFGRPCGLSCDSTIFINNLNNYYVYIADRAKNCIVRAYYNTVDSTMYFYDYMLMGLLAGPEDVACIAIPSGGSYMVISDTKNHCIRLVKISANLTYTLLKTYGSEGPGIGQFQSPTSVTIVSCRDSLEYYRIYIVDQSNHRIVSLLYNTVLNTIIWEREYRDSTMSAEFHSLTSSSYYCVYVTDRLHQNIWTFTPGLHELLYTYGDHNQFDNPFDLCIYENEIVVTENWTNNSGIQYFKIIPEIREFYPEPQNFDATEDSVKINFRVDETAHYLTMEVAGKRIFENQYFVPGHYSVYWDGRGADGKVVLPGNYTIRIRCQQEVIATAGVTVKGTLKSGILAQDEHWTEEGEPYVLVGDVQVAPNGRLERQREMRK